MINILSLIEKSNGKANIFFSKEKTVGKPTVVLDILYKFIM